MPDQHKPIDSGGPTRDPFQALGVDRRFDLDAGEIEAAFLRRLTGAHPDVAGEGASSAAADLNEARAALIDPERRASVLLSLLGGPDAARVRELPDGFLLGIMELRAEIEQDLEGGDPDSRSRWERFAAARRGEHIQTVQELFDGLGDEPGSEALASLRVELNAWRYTERLIEQLDPGYDPGRADFA
ncbi:MAG: hypothetical protein AAGA55_00070 [Planctomycetota bacterium]